MLLIDELVRFAGTLDEQWHSPLADAAAECWNLERPLFIRSSAAHVFVARSKGDGPRVVLRLRPDSAESAAVLQRGARAAQAWSRAGKPFVDAVPSEAGRLVETVDGYVATALIAAEGEPLEESAIDIPSARLWGEAVARLHRHEVTALLSDIPTTEDLLTGEDLDHELAPALSTVRAHLEVLAQVAPEVLPSYLAMARLTADRAIASGRLAPDPLRPVAEALVVEMGGEPVWLTEQQRPLWHAALAHGANHLTTLVASSADLLRTAGVEEPGQVLGPLLGAALAGALRAGCAALTGPVARGDAGTVRAHLEVLAQVAPEVLPSYVAMARLTADRALASGRLDPERAGALLAVLGSVSR